LISKLDIDVGIIVIKKSAVRIHLRDKKNILYNFIVAEYIARTILSNYDEINHIELHLDLSMSKTSRDHFNGYFARKIDSMAYILKISSLISNKIYHDHSHDEPCIQIADYVAGSIRQLYECNDSRYYEMIEKQILYSDEWGINK
jgi:hypothetical protein